MVIGAVPLALVAHPSFAPRNLPGMVALAKAQPGRLNYASSGNGTIIQLAFEALKLATGIFVTHIPYRSMGQALTDVISNQVPMLDRRGRARGHQRRRRATPARGAGPHPAQW